MSKLVEDFKRDGKWAKTSTTDGYMRYTRVYNLWDNMRTRCNPRSAVVRNNPKYLGCSLAEPFLDFQYFAHWCQLQVGYGEKGFQIDKDLLVKGNKIYGPELCVFLPAQINSFITRADSIRGELPIGVTKVRSSFRAGISIDGSTKILGTYGTPAEAFLAYKKAKEDLAKILALRYSSRIDKRAVDALLNYCVNIDD